MHYAYARIFYASETKIEFLRKSDFESYLLLWYINIARTRCLLFYNEKHLNLTNSNP